jgi:hypothetical protein
MFSRISETAATLKRTNVQTLERSAILDRYMRARRFLSTVNGTRTTIQFSRSLIGLTVLFLLVSSTITAGPIEERVRGHIAAAVDGGLEPADYHHLILAFSWRDTLEDLSLIHI